MNTIRIPNRYRSQLLRLPEKDRLFIFDSLMSLSLGENVNIPDSMSGDVLVLIWRDCVQMEKKNGKSSELSVGECVAVNCASNPPSNPHTEVKGSEVKGSEVKGNEKKGKEKKKKFLEYVFLTEEEEKKLREDFGDSKFLSCVEKLDNFIPNSKAGRAYKDHNRVLRGWVLKWYDQDNQTMTVI